MRAVVCPRYGPPEVLQIRELAAPVPGRGELLVRVMATTVTSGDSRIRGFRMPSPVFSLMGRLALGLRGPRRAVLGSELAGIVVALGPGVTLFAVGDAVVAFTDTAMGAHAELVTLAESAAVVHKPEQLSYAQAAALPFGATTARYFLQVLGNVQSGQRVLVVGASGAVGVAAVQLAVHFGARVHAVCSGANAELVRSLGASRVFDYTREDFTASASRYDMVLDTVGATSLKHCRRVLAPDGRFLPVVMTMREVRQLMTTRLFRGPRVLSGMATGHKAELQELVNLAAAGTLRPVIGRTFSFDDIAAAHRYVDAGRKVGSAVVLVDQQGHR